MREFGSEFTYIENPSIIVGTEIQKTHCNIMRCGRDALSLVAVEIKHLSIYSDNVLVPTLACDSMIKPFSENGYKKMFYKINSNLTINQEDILQKVRNNRIDAILIMHYFRYENNDEFYKKLKMINSNIFIIEDLTQTILWNNIEQVFNDLGMVDFTVASLRKWIGIPNGALAINQKKEFSTKCYYKENIFTELRSDAFEIKNKYFQNNELSYKIKYREMFAKAEISLNYNEFYLADPISEKLLKNLNIQDVVYKRQINFNHMLEKFKYVNELKIMHLNSLFSLPVIVKNGERDNAQRELAFNGIYTQVLWPISDDAKEIDENAKYFSDNMLSIPIDQRYKFEDVEYIANTVKTVLNSLNYKRMNKKKILIIGASVLQLPAIRKAKEMGLYVGVVDYNDKAVGISFANEYFNCSTIDSEGILKIARDFKPHGIMTMATDMPMRSIAYVCKELGLNAITPECSILCTNKLRMIERFKECNIESPWYFSASNKEELVNISCKIDYPCIMKPIDSSGSRGVVLCKNSPELLKEYSYAVSNSKDKIVIVEEYMQGDEVSVEVFVENGKPHVLQITDKITTGAPHFVEMGHTQPTRLKNIAEIEMLATRAVIALEILNGPAHVEIMSTNQGAKIIEIGARMGGDCITSHLVPLSTGIDMTQNTINYAIGEPLELVKKFNRISAIRYLSSHDVGIIKTIYGTEDASNVKYIVEVVITKNIGDRITAICSSSDRVGYVIASADTYEECEKACSDALDKITIEVSKEIN